MKPTEQQLRLARKNYTIYPKPGTRDARFNIGYRKIDGHWYRMSSMGPMVKLPGPPEPLNDYYVSATSLPA